MDEDLIDVGDDLGKDRVVTKMCGCWLLLGWGTVVFGFAICCCS